MTKLPGVLAEIAEIVGADTALALALALGGQSIHVPKRNNLEPDHPLSRAAGPAAPEIAARYAGESLYIPHARRTLVLHLSGQGRSAREIAAMLGISPRAVRQHRRRAQGNMFP